MQKPLFFDPTEGNESRPIAALFVQPDTIYRTIPGVECYDEKRDALTFPGGRPVVCHPPCRKWSVMRKLSTAPEKERELARWAVQCVQTCGGVLEHPAGSSLWKDQGLPHGCSHDSYGGFTLQVSQWHFGHPAAKNTWLYICGVWPEYLPPIPFRPGEPGHLVCASWHNKEDVRKVLGPKQRSATPPAFAAWLVEVARMARCSHPAFMPPAPGVRLTCPACGGLFRAIGKGRPPEFCNDACRLRAWRQAQGAERAAE